MKYYNCKEDLIGEKIKCPYPDCNVEFTIIDGKMEHTGKGHVYITTLDEQWEYYKLNLESTRRLYYGK